MLLLLQAEVVPPGRVRNDAFLAGYGAAERPGPLFSFAAYLGTVIGGWGMGLLCLIAVLLPSVLLVVGALPFWEALRRTTVVQAALKGVTPPWSASCWRRSIIRFGLLVSPARATLPWR